MESILVDIKNSVEEKVLLDFLNSQKMNYTKIDLDKEEEGLLKAIEEGKKEGRATIEQQQEFETWLKSL